MGNDLSSQRKIPGSQTIHNRPRALPSRLLSGARVGTTVVRSERSRAARSSTSASVPYPRAFFPSRGWEPPQFAAKDPGQPDHPQPPPCPTRAPSFWREGGNHLSSQHKIPGSQTIHNRVRALPSRLLSGARVGNHLSSQHKFPGSQTIHNRIRALPLRLVSGARAGTTSVRSERSRAARPSTTAPVPYPRAFLPSRGWEPPQFAAKDPRQPDHPQPPPCPTLAPSFWREGGNHLSSQHKIPGSQTIHNRVRALPSRLFSVARAGTTVVRSKGSWAARPSTTASVPYPRAFFLARGWETTAVRSERSRESQINRNRPHSPSPISSSTVLKKPASPMPASGWASAKPS